MQTTIRPAILVLPFLLAACQPNNPAPTVVDGEAKGGPTEPADARQGGGDSPAAFARTLQLPPQGPGVVEFPLADGATGVWRSVRDGVQVQGTQRGVRVAYKRSRGEAAGAALVIRPGALTAGMVLSLAVDSATSTNLSICLTQEDGSVWSLGSVRARSGAEEVRRPLADAEWDPYQNNGRKRVPFDPAKVYMITLLDLGGFMGGSEGNFEWTVTSLKGTGR